jgi:hypothetical protein
LPVWIGDFNNIDYVTEATFTQRRSASRCACDWGSTPG